MNISAISFTGRPPMVKSSKFNKLERQSAKAVEFGLTTNKYRNQKKVHSLNQEIELYREILKENPNDQLYRQLLENALSELKALKR